MATRKVGLVVKVRRASVARGVERLHYNFQIGQKPTRTEKLFEPLSIAQVQALREYSLRTGKRPRVSMLVYANEIREEKFYPFGVNEETARQLDAPLRSGIGARITRAVAAHLASQHPHHRVLHARSGPNWVISRAREAQLSAMGVKLGQRYSTTEYHNIIHQYVERKTR